MQAETPSQLRTIIQWQTVETAPLQTEPAVFDSNLAVELFNCLLKGAKTGGRRSFAFSPGF